MRIKDFYSRVDPNEGPDREIGEWKIIDIHEIPYPMLHDHEVDFYCCNNKTVYLLRLRNRATRKLEIAYGKKGDGYPPYLIAELPIDIIDDNLIKTLLGEFSKMVQDNNSAKGTKVNKKKEG